MQRYFVVNKDLKLNSQDIFHISKVMRMKINDIIEIAYDKKVYLCKLTNISKDEVNYEILEEKMENNELETKITIAFSLVNETKIDFILQKCTELGAYDFIPLNLERCKVKIDKKEDKKISRWNLITKEASEQSYRNICPKVHNIMSIKELVKLDYDLKIFCSTKEKEKTIKNVLQNNLNCDRIIIVVGPEGGISKKEEDFLISNNFKGITFGNTILRTETAPIFAVSAIKYELMR